MTGGLIKGLMYKYKYAQMAVVDVFIIFTQGVCGRPIRGLLYKIDPPDDGTIQLLIALEMRMNRNIG